MGLIVEVEDHRIKKPLLGGWRQRDTGVIYLNAASQTGPLAKSNVENLRSQGVQYEEIKNAFCQSSVDASTQMWRRDYYIPCENDKYLTAKPYESSEQREMRTDLDGKVRAIQKFYRSYKMLKNIKECTQAYRKIVEDCKKFEEEKDDLHRRRHQLEIIRQTYPQTRSDFEKIYSLIEGWKLTRLDFIKRGLFSSSVKAENVQILEKMVEMLRDVEKHRRIISEEHKRKEFMKFLDFHCEPVEWTGYKRKPVKMITLRVQKAREYKKLHDDLCNENFTLEKRLEILILLKNSLKIHNCFPGNELMSLIDQEIILSSRGIKGLSLENLRKRISHAFLYFARNSHNCCFFENNNNEDMELSDPVEEKRFCQSCMKFIPCKRFTVHVRMRKLPCCSGCTWLRQQSVEKVDYDPYTYLLNGIRADENRRNCFSTLLYVIQEPGIYHLVKNIWHGRSVVSEIDDIFRLRLVRFYVDQEWAPWNCILLTEEESEAHYYIKDIKTVYSKVLLHRIYLIHEIARSHFDDLIKFEQKFRASSRYQLVQEFFGTS